MFYLVKISLYQVTAEQRFAWLSAVFRLAQMISFLFCLHLGLPPNFFLKMRLQICWRIEDDLRIQAWKASGASAYPWRGGVVHIVKEFYRLISFFFFPPNIFAFWYLLLHVLCLEEGLPFTSRRNPWLLEKRQSNTPSPFLIHTSDPLHLLQCDVCSSLTLKDASVRLHLLFHHEC